jgi:transposase
MPRRRIDMKKIREVLRLKHDRGASTRQIADSLRLSVSTVSEYLYRANAAGHTWPLPENLSDEDLERSLFPGPVKPGEPPRPLPDWQKVRTELSRKGVTLLLLWREYKSARPDGYGYSRFAGLYSDWEKKTEVRMLQRHKSGEKLFVDFAGVTGRVTDPETGEIAEVQIFVAAMGSSQKVFARACPAQDTRSWIQAHIAAFEFYGALPQVVVPDNLKAGVSSPCYYEPTLNAAYAEMARYYELTVLPARVRKPRDKAKVENAVQQVERWVLAPLRDQTFFQISELNHAIAGLVEELNSRVMKGPGASRNDLFLSEDLPAMRPLPLQRYSYAVWKTAKVAPDYHVEHEGHKYSVPHEWVGKRVELRIGANVLEVFAGSQKLVSHPLSLSRRGFTTVEAHMPESHQWSRWNPERLRRWAAAVGPEAELFVTRALESKAHKEHAYRGILGVLKLEKTVGRDRLEAACARANSVGALHYSNVKSILNKNLEGASLPQDLPALPPHDNVRGAHYFWNQGEICDN